MGEKHPPTDFDSWDFHPSTRFELEVLRLFTTSVHHPSSSRAGFFFMLAVFCRSFFRLSEESIGMALHSILGSSLSGYHVGCFKPYNLCFSVASKEVGFLIVAKKRVTTDQFDVYFHLWRDWRGD
jgi:hypothetical protein